MTRNTYTRPAHGRRPVLGAALATVLLVLAPAASAGEAQRAAFLGMTFIDTSPGEASEAEAARLELAEDLLVERLSESGRFTFVDVAPVAEKADRYVNLAHCNGCDTDLAKELGADVAITGEIQKTSNLILHISIYIRDAETAALVGGGSADIRSNTDESWSRGVTYIVKNRILRE